MGESAGGSLRVLCTSTPGAGHIGALAPVALALRAAGHDVHWATAVEAGPAVEAMGFAWSAAGITTAARREAAGADIERISRIPPADRRGPLYAALFARVAAPRMHADLEPVVDRVRPDVIVREVGELGAVVLAASRGLPLVTVAFSGALPPWARTETLEALAPLWVANGVRPPSWADLCGQLYVHPFPPSFGQRPDDVEVRMVRPQTSAPDGDPPPWLSAPGPGWVYVTSGTEMPARTFPWNDVLAAVDRLGLRAIATVGRHVDLSTLDVPASARVERFVPQALVLPRAVAVVSHGGAGTVLGAAARGVQQLVVPLWADQWENGRAVVDGGCGVVLGPGERGTGEIEHALSRLLTPAYQDAAARIATEVAAMPTADALVPDVERLAAVA